MTVIPWKKWLTREGKNEDTDGDDPWHSAIALPKLVHYILKEDAQALDAPIGADLHQEEGYSHNPAPAAIRHLWVNIWTQAMKGLQHPHGYSRSPGGRHTDTISVFIVLSTWGQKNSVTKTFMTNTAAAAAAAGKTAVTSTVTGLNTKCTQTPKHWAKEG